MVTTTISEGWLTHAAPYTVPSFATLSYFGLPLVGNDGVVDAPLRFQEKNENTFGTYYPTSVATGAKPADQVKFQFTPVNAIFLYHQLGKAVDSGGGIRTITTMDGTARKPHLGVWQQTGTKKYGHAGSIIHSTTINFDWRSGLSVAQNAKAMSHAADTTSPTITYPSSIVNPFVHFSSLTWNGGSVMPIEKFSMVMSHDVSGYMAPAGDYYQELNEFTPQSFAYNMQFSCENGETLLADFQAGTERALVWKVCKADATKYIQCTQNCTFFTLIPTRTYGKDSIYSATLKGEAPTFATLDGVANSFFGL